MLGFPTETLEEIEATVTYAMKSGLAQANFFNVVPQPGTPLYDLALKESPAALRAQTLQEYQAKDAWYTVAYGADMKKILDRAYKRFYFRNPRRWLRLLRVMPWKNFAIEVFYFFELVFRKTQYQDEPLPEELQPLTHLYDIDEFVLTSAEAQRKRRPPQVVQELSAQS
jgi:radical SAM superfamily enzyme YgiQ (UPF0313 family)